MANNKIMSIGPVALTTTLTTNILNGAVTSLSGPVGLTLTQPLIYLKHLRIVNKTASAATFSLWLGATGANTAGTEVVGTAQSVAANSSYDWYAPSPGLPMTSTQFLVGGASANTTLTLQGELEIGFS